MPQVSTIKDFLYSLKYKQTATTEALKKIWDERGDDDVAPHLGSPGLRDANHLVSGPGGKLPDWVDKALRKRGLGDGEIDHINEWPALAKEEVRLAYIKAIDDPREIEFEWELHDGHDSDNPIPPVTGPTDPIKVTFRSPRKNLSKSSLTVGEINTSI